MATYTIDKSHSEVGFAVRHMMFAKVRGRFKSWSGDVAFDPSDPSKSRLAVEIDTASIDTGEEKRDAHLRSDDFFASERFPKMTFASKRVTKKADAEYEVVGDLTIRDVTREVTLEVEQTGGGKDPWGNDRLGFSAKGAISRGEWGLKWNQALETGGVLVSDKVEIAIEVELVAGK